MAEKMTRFADMLDALATWLWQPDQHDGLRWGPPNYRLRHKLAWQVHSLAWAIKRRALDEASHEH